MAKKKPTKTKKPKKKKRTLVQGQLPFPLICDRCGKPMRRTDKAACAKFAKEEGEE